ncbi:hypothetical protein L1987_58305 [Smallanthus sonchifolius]|uniref:Uncharacterized protein n=1 Tax=Smallanthus sonchifolius TaxID=185202 RepID=A0ACB9DFC9_9ASTR|nr:hypothetical protein L1987_58305 [Smallanthus sonchifolius]
MVLESALMMGGVVSDFVAQEEENCSLNFLFTSGLERKQNSGPQIRRFKNPTGGTLLTESPFSNRSSVILSIPDNRTTISTLFQKERQELTRFEWI